MPISYRIKVCFSYKLADVAEAEKTYRKEIISVDEILPALPVLEHMLLENASDSFWKRHIGTCFLLLLARESLVIEDEVRSYLDLSCMKYGRAQSIPLIPYRAVLAPRPRGI